jgi:citronellol/citronellal dehydrogenase
MNSSHTFAGRTVFMTGGSRGIGLAIARRLARNGANIAFVAKTDKPDPRLPGTVHTAAKEIQASGGEALPIVGDIRDEQAVSYAVRQTIAHFGGIDIVINNASAIALQGIPSLALKSYDLMQDINVRGSFVVLTETLPYLLDSDCAQVLSLSPPLNLDRRWLSDHAPYTISKYGMTMLTLGVAEQHRGKPISSNCLWPKTLIATAAVSNIVAPGAALTTARTPEIMAEAAALILSRTPGEVTGECLIDENVLRDHAGVTDFSPFLAQDATEESLQDDMFL